MKELRFLLLVTVICLASGVKAQFYDSADDIYYYVEWKNGKYGADVYIFNFDGRKACRWYNSVVLMKDYLKRNPSYYEEKVETADYSFLKYITYNTYQEGNSEYYINYQFSSDRQTLTEIRHYHKFEQVEEWWGGYPITRSVDRGFVDEVFGIYKKVDKSFFKVGRSRTPSGTLHE